MAKKAEATAEESVNKMDLVRQALTALGEGAKPKEIQNHIQEAHKVEIPTQIISSYKSMIRTSAKPGGGSGSTRKASSKSEGHMSLDDIHAVKQLIDRVGAGQLVKLIDTLK